MGLWEEDPGVMSQSINHSYISQHDGKSICGIYHAI